MVTHAFSLVLATLTVGFVLITASDSISMTIKPEKCMTAMQESVDINCKVDDALDQGTNEVTLIEVSRNDEMPIAYLRHCGNLTYGNGVPSNFEAEGHIGKDSDQSYLTLTLHNPRSEDTGIYTCAVYYVDENGIFQHETRSQNLVVEKLDVSSLETVLTQIKQKLNQVETNSEKKIKELIRKTTDDVIAFSATKNDSSFLFGKGADIILPDVIMDKGQGYDPNKGVFHAPRQGLYVFHLTVRMGTSNHRMSVNLVANNQHLARLYAGDNSYPGQSAVTGVAYLATGDKVKAVVDGIYGNGNVQGYAFTLFSGYLVNSN